MAVSCKVIRFQKTTSTTANVTQDIDATFVPKACIVVSTGTATSDSAQAHFQSSYGFSDGTNNRCTTVVSRDANATQSNAKIERNDGCITLLNETAPTTIVDRASISFPSGNTVRFTWQVSSATAKWVTLVVFGGDDILNVKVGTHVIQSTTITTENVTGLGFTPVADKAVIFATTINNATENTASTGAIQSVGVATSSTKRHNKGIAITNASDPSTTWVYAKNDSFLSGFLSAGSVDWEIDFDGWITDGFRLEMINAPSTATQPFYYMVINGGNWDCGTDTIQLSNGLNKNHTVSVSSNTLRGLLLMNMPNPTLGFQTTGTIGNDHAILQFGASDGTTEAYDVTLDEDAQNTMDSYRQTGGNASNTNRCLIMMTTNGATQIAADFSSFGTNQFTLTYTTTTGSASNFGWVVVADSPTSQNFNGNITETSISVSETLARILGALRPISEPSISSGETLTRLLGALRPISETSITVDQTLTGIRSVPRSISEPSITVDQTISTLLAATRPISEPSVSSGETLTRILGALRSINESSITSGETLTRILGAIRSITEPSISVDETLTRLLGATRTITESSLTVNQTLTRILGALRSISEPSITINDSITKSFGTLRTISENSISVGETLTRLLGALRSIAETAITTDDSVSGIKQTGGVSITEDAITVNDSVTRIQALIKTITEDTITINQTLDRILGALRTVSEPSISINDSVTRLRETLGSISESAITIDDTLTRIQNIIKTITEDTDIDQTLQALRTSYVTIVEAYVKWYYSLLTYKGGS